MFGLPRADSVYGRFTFRPLLEELQHRRCPAGLTVNGDEVVYTAEFDETNVVSFTMLFDPMQGITFQLNDSGTQGNGQPIQIEYNGQTYQGGVTIPGLVPTLIDIFLANKGDTLTNMTNIRCEAEGGSGADTMVGGWGVDIFKGDTGDDSLRGGHGDDILEGGDNTDILQGEDGADSLAGNGDTDHLWGGNHGDVLNGNEGEDWMHGGAGNDFLFGGEGEYTDRMWGDEDDDRLEGMDGNDVLMGGIGNDHCYGGTAFDDGGWDEIRGNDGIDTFLAIEVQSGEVKDFTQGVDREV